MGSDFLVKQTQHTQNIDVSNSLSMTSTIDDFDVRLAVVWQNFKNLVQEKLIEKNTLHLEVLKHLVIIQSPESRQMSEQLLKEYLGNETNTGQESVLRSTLKSFYEKWYGKSEPTPSKLSKVQLQIFGTREFKQALPDLPSFPIAVQLFPEIKEKFATKAEEHSQKLLQIATAIKVKNPVNLTMVTGMFMLEGEYDNLQSKINATGKQLTLITENCERLKQIKDQALLGGTLHLYIEDIDQSGKDIQAKKQELVQSLQGLKDDDQKKFNDYLDEIVNLVEYKKGRDLIVRLLAEFAEEYAFLNQIEDEYKNNANLYSEGYAKQIKNERIKGLKDGSDPLIHELKKKKEDIARTLNNLYNEYIDETAERLFKRFLGLNVDMPLPLEYRKITKAS